MIQFREIELDGENYTVALHAEGSPNESYTVVYSTPNGIVLEVEPYNSLWLECVGSAFA